MTKIALVAGGDLADFSDTFDLYVGVDRGSLALIKAGLPLYLAVGDFDSVTSRELITIKSAANECIELPREKDDTDLEFAIKTILQRYPQAQLTIYGALGGRLDHSLTNVFLPSHPDIHQFMRQISLEDRQNKVIYYPAGCHQVHKIPDYHYVAFLVEGRGRLTISDAKYNLNSQNFFERKLYASNEFLDKPMTVDLTSGYLVVIYSKDL